MLRPSSPLHVWQRSIYLWNSNESGRVFLRFHHGLAPTVRGSMPWSSSGATAPIISQARSYRDSTFVPPRCLPDLACTTEQKRKQIQARIDDVEDQPVSSASLPGDVR